MRFKFSNLFNRPRDFPVPATNATEEELRELKTPWPQNETELLKVIRSLVHREHNYGTCVYAMSISSVATMHYVSHMLGVSGFQASCADLDIFSRSRNLDGPFIVLNGRDLLYPQYNLQEKLDEFITSIQPYLKEAATKELAAVDSFVSPVVIKHWEKLSGKEN